LRHGRYETVGTAILGLVLLGSRRRSPREASSRFAESVVPARSPLGGGSQHRPKEWLYQITVRVGRRLESPLVVANAWHHRSDALSSVAALAGIAGARMGFPILDPAAAVVVAAMIAMMAVSLLAGAVREVTDTALQRDMLRDLGAGIRCLPGVVNLHELRARRMGPRVLVDLHVQVDAATTVSDGHQVAERVRQFVFREHRGISEVLVHIDPEPDQDLAPGEQLSRPRGEIESVRRIAGGSRVRAVTHDGPLLDRRWCSRSRSRWTELASAKRRGRRSLRRGSRRWRASAPRTSTWARRPRAPDLAATRATPRSGR
jgi:cation diffusion facilitator family transporter